VSSAAPPVIVQNSGQKSVAKLSMGRVPSLNAFRLALRVRRGALLTQDELL
jgi:hypothetical protein